MQEVKEAFSSARRQERKRAEDEERANFESKLMRSYTRRCTRAKPCVKIAAPAEEEMNVEFDEHAVEFDEFDSTEVEFDEHAVGEALDSNLPRWEPLVFSASHQVEAAKRRELQEAQRMSEALSEFNENKFWVPRGMERCASHVVIIALMEFVVVRHPTKSLQKLNNILQVELDDMEDLSTSLDCSSLT